ncbi:MAG: hypothetical protein HC908_09670 [Calothrix sp. SM1_7_51]|nr:hypothetical protein [Calothrix sp. SM1_7_51]
MNYQEAHKILERRRLLKLAHEYRQKGYSVDIYPTSGKLPPTLANLSLDLIAVKGSEVIAAKVRTRETLSLNGSEDLRRISESVEKLPGWVFELVVTNSRT